MAIKNTEANEDRPTLLINVLVSSVLGFLCGGLGFVILSSLNAPSNTEVERLAYKDVTAVVPFDKVVLYLGDDAVHKFELKTQEIETRADKTANMKKFAELLASMPPASAAEAILEMMNNRESNFAIQLLHHMEPRNASKVLAEIGDAQMVYQIAAGFRAAPVMR